ncbi:MAG: hypothetical protein HOA16_09765 [Opitutae bacterium]|jgi:hypothetical protein|nr:hypothetical protein [Opitutae bacterium]
MKSKDELLEYLSEIPEGEVSPEHDDRLCLLIREVWAELGITDVVDLPLPAKKIDQDVHQFAKVEWHPPVISFELERHGAIAVGYSTYAEVYRIGLDLESGEPQKTYPKKRQVKKPSPAMKSKEKAAEIIDAVGKRGKHPGILRKDDVVRIKIDCFIPSEGVVKKTLESRRKNVRAKVDQGLVELGYEKIANWRFRVPD